MENKYTREIDRLFKMYGPDKKIILLCQVGEHNFQEWSFYAFTHGWESNKSQAIDPDDAELRDQFSKEKECFENMLTDSFPDKFDFEIDSRQCDDDFSIWVYVTRDYKVCRKHTNQSLLTKDNADRVLVDLTAYSDEIANDMPERQINKKVANLVDEINSLTAKLKSDFRKNEARGILGCINAV